MSEQEFEVYLSLIAKLLRLSDAQREAISDELRDHMQARLDELMAEGLSREQAIHTAIEEFGDAAGLADQFTRITRQHILRRRIMRTSIGALAVAATIALAFLYLMPQNRPGMSGPALSHAKETVSTPNVSDAPVITAGEPDPVREHFAKRIDANFDENRLANVFDYLRNTTGVNLFVNWQALEAAGTDRDTLVSLTLKDTPAETVLSLLLQLFNTGKTDHSTILDYAVVDGVVVISSKEDIDGLRVVRIYDCIDLIDRPVQEPSAKLPDTGGYGMTAYSATPGEESGGRPAVQSNGRGRASVSAPGVYGGGMGMEGGYGAYGGMDPFAAQSTGNNDHRSRELLGLVNILLDDGNSGEASYYDDMLVIIATHKTHQRVRETLTLLRRAQVDRR